MKPPAAMLVPDGLERGRCKWGCGKTIMWAPILDPVTLHCRRNRDGSKAKVPLNPIPHPDGTWKYDSTVHRGVRWIAGGEIVAADERYQGHHVTCPHAQDRKPRRIQKAGAAKAAPAAAAPQPEAELVLFTTEPGRTS